MRTKNILLIMLSVAGLTMNCLFSGCGVRNASGPSTSEVEYAVRDGIESKDFEILVRNARLRNGRNVSLTSGYSLVVAGDSIRSYLPYYGEAHSIPYAKGEGLFFVGPIDDYKAVAGKGGVSEISFRVQTYEDLYYFNITVRRNGYSTIGVRPISKQAISYDGVMNIYETNQ